MKRLVCCLDGTWNTPDQEGNPTNVTEIMRAIRPADDAGVAQVVFYDKGVGTGGWINRLRGGAFGRGLGENVRDAYRFLVKNHEPGDELYLFGFSRGAFTARSLCGLITSVGLLRDERAVTTADAWAAYRQPKDDPQRAERIAAIGAYIVPGVRIRLVGVWDTVGALGIPGNWLSWGMRKRHAFHDTRLGGHIDHAFHALAIDERRGPFVPTLWRTSDNTALPASDEAGDGCRPIVEQVWFPGVHTDVGGGYADNRLSRLPLRWMIERAATSTGLAFCPPGEPADGDPLAPAHESRTPQYLASRWLPMMRVIGGVLPVTDRRLRLRAQWRQAEVEGRGVNECIHRAALERLGQEAEVIRGDRRETRRYAPPNLEAVQDHLPVVEHDGTITRPAQS